MSQVPVVSSHITDRVPHFSHAVVGLVVVHGFFSPVHAPYRHVLGLQVLVPPFPHEALVIPVHSLAAGLVHVPTSHAP